jgi:formylglycine-generating enzyme required for sulfatase activity
MSWELSRAQFPDRKSGSTPSEAPAAAWINPRDGSIMRLVPAGEFVMGSTPEQIDAARVLDIGGHEFTLLDELPQFQAFVPNYYLSQHVVTNQQFAVFLSATRPSPQELKRLAPVLERIVVPATETEPYQVAPGFERHPAIHVSWFGGDAYCRWAGLRLPTEIEWEKAARGTDGRFYPWGNEWHDDFLRWHNSARGGQTTAPVDAYPEGRSPYGIFQMAGNVDEWCADWYQWDVHKRYATGDLRLPPSGEMRVVRGGTCVGWQRIRFRCAHRRGNDPAIVNVLYTGIRCAADVQLGS